MKRVLTTHYLGILREMPSEGSGFGTSITPGSKIACRMPRYGTLEARFWDRFPWLRVWGLGFRLGTAPLSNSWIIIRIWAYIALNRTPNMDCYWMGQYPKAFTMKQMGILQGMQGRVFRRWDCSVGGWNLSALTKP